MTIACVMISKIHRPVLNIHVDTQYLGDLLTAASHILLLHFVMLLPVFFNG